MVMIHSSKSPEPASLTSLVGSNFSPGHSTDECCQADSGTGIQFAHRIFCVCLFGALLARMYASL
jgi:hypothetical protein